MVPSLDTFRFKAVGTFGKSMGHDPYIERYEREFIPLIRWDVKDAMATLWTIEPVFSSVVVRNNEKDVRFTLTTYFKYLEWIEPMSMTMYATTVKPGNEISGPWVGRVAWMAGKDVGWTDSAHSMWNTSLTLFANSIHDKDSDSVSFAMIPESTIYLPPTPATWRRA